MFASMGMTILFFVVCAAVVVVAALLYGRYKKRKDAEYLLSFWGTPCDRYYSFGELDEIRKTALFLSPDPIVDDITWHDVEMDLVYQKMNHSFTNAGDHALYSMLRNPQKERLQENAQMVRWAKDNAGQREFAKQKLYRLGRLEGTDLSLLLKDSPYKPSIRVLAIVLCLGLIASIVFALLGFLPALIALVALVAGNIVFSVRMHRVHSDYMNTIVYLVSVSHCAHKICEKVELPAVFRTKHIETILKETDSIRKSAISDLFYSEDSIVLLINQLFLLETISFVSVVKKIRDHREELLELYLWLGRLDALVAAASFRESLPYYCEPEWIEGSVCRLEFEQMAHPLLKDAVPNSCNIEQNILLTGSNATGKSTFLKMVAINSILAQTVNTCLAKRWKGTFLKVYTSMALRDSIVKEESYFVTEIKSLKRMLNAAEAPSATLLIVDEVLRGTNTGERIAASSEVLLQFAKKDCLCIAATHDIELSYILEECYQNMHFTEEIQNKQMLFDYKIKKGRSKSKNAIKLLELFDYNDKLVLHANERLREFEENGMWRKGEL